MEFLCLTVFLAAAEHVWNGQVSVRERGSHQCTLHPMTPLQVEHITLPPWAVRAGAQRIIYHDPQTTVAAVVTCGRLCPGVNDVVQVTGG